jgi:CheY-like chemotaxis protein
MTTGEKPKILLVDDEKEVREICKELLEVAGYGVQTAVHGLDALEKLKDTEYDLVIIDVNMPKLDGIDLYRASVKDYPYLKDRCLFITGDLSGELEAASVFLQMDERVLKKPFKMDDLLDKVASLLGNAG